MQQLDHVIRSFQPQFLLHHQTPVLHYAHTTRAIDKIIYLFNGYIRMFRNISENLGLVKAMGHNKNASKKTACSKGSGTEQIQKNFRSPKKFQYIDHMRGYLFLLCSG